MFRLNGRNGTPERNGPPEQHETESSEIQPAAAPCCFPAVGLHSSANYITNSEIQDYVHVGYACMSLSNVRVVGNWLAIALSRVQLQF